MQISLGAGNENELDRSIGTENLALLRRAVLGTGKAFFRVGPESRNR